MEDTAVINCLPWRTRATCIYVYRGGRAPRDITHAIIDKSVTEIDSQAFDFNRNLRSVETHDGLKRIKGHSTFRGCTSLTDIDIRSVETIECWVFEGAGLREVDCDNLLYVCKSAFQDCKSLRRISLPHVKIIMDWAFHETALTEVNLPEVVVIKQFAFADNKSLRRIAIPLNPHLFDLEPRDFDSDEDPEGAKDSAFDGCDCLVQVDLVGWIHETVSSLQLERWRNEMNEEIAKINETLPSRAYGKTAAIRRWMESVASKIIHYQDEHNIVLKEAATILELALWQVKLCDETFGELVVEREDMRTTRGQRKRARLENRQMARVTCGADIIITNVMPFLQLWHQERFIEDCVVVS